MKKIVFSLVLFKNSFKEIKSLIDNFIEFRRIAKFNNVESLLLINDNSPYLDSELVTKLNKKDILYKFNNKNFGFGKSHNLNLFSLSEIKNNYIFIIVNPDIQFDPNSLFEFIKRFYKSDFVCTAPLIRNKNGEIQYSAKNNPSILSLLIGRFSVLRNIRFFNNYYKNHINLCFDYTYDHIKCSYLSGCFLLIKSKTFFKIRGFDERFFLHLEDADISRRCSIEGEVVHDPSCTVIHYWARGSHKSFKQVFFLIISMIKYFLKWGFKII